MGGIAAYRKGSKETFSTLPRIAVPIRKNRDLDRFNGLLGSGWTCKTFGLTPSLEIVAYLSKEETPLVPRKNVLGIDINAKDFAYTVLTQEGEILKQGWLLYHGSDAPGLEAVPVPVLGRGKPTASAVGS